MYYVGNPKTHREGTWFWDVGEGVSILGVRGLDLQNLSILCFFPMLILLQISWDPQISNRLIPMCWSSFFVFNFYFVLPHVKFQEVPPPP